MLIHDKKQCHKYYRLFIQFIHMLVSDGRRYFRRMAFFHPSSVPVQLDSPTEAETY